jgi:outer membrane protein assembly factor BamB
MHSWSAMGAATWPHTIQLGPDEPEATVTVANGVVYDIADSGELMMFNSATGAFLGSIVDPDGHPFNPLFGSQPAVVNGAVYIPTWNRVDAFRLP